MKVEICHGVAQKKYPYIGQAESGRIVLFTSADTGMQVNDTYGDHGKTHAAWSESDFAPFAGTVTLSND